MSDILPTRKGWGGCHYAKDIRFEIRTEHRRDYHEAANFLNLSDTDVICLQHEFGIFGGKNGLIGLDGK